MAHASSSSATSEISSVETLIKFLEKVYNVVSEFIIDENGRVKNVFFQDPSMKDMFNFFPERICIDCTYKQFEIGFYMYIFICEDSNGKNIIIGVGFLQVNDVDSLTWLFDTFKQHNPNWRRIKSLAVDFQIKQRELVKGCFPQALQIICFFHAYVCFKNGIEKFHTSNYVTEEQILFANDLFRNLYFAQNQAEFELRYALYSSLPHVLVSYLDNVWMPHQQEWRISLDYAHEDVFHNINFFLQDVCDAIAAISAVNSNYIQFVKEIFLYISIKKKEKVSAFQKPDTVIYSRFTSEYQITKVFTPYAAKFVIKQLDLSKDINCKINGNTDTYTFNYLGLSISATISQCSCHFFLFTLLPCRHIFVARKMNHCVFDDSLVIEAWGLKYYEHSLICMDGHLEKGTNSQIPKDAASRTSLAHHLFGSSFLPILELSCEAFTEKMELLHRILEAWKNDNDISLQFVGIEQSSCKLHKPNMSNSDAFSLCTSKGNQFLKSRSMSNSAFPKFTNIPCIGYELNCAEISSTANSLLPYQTNIEDTSMSSMMVDILSSSVPTIIHDIPSTSYDISACDIPTTSSGLDDISSTLRCFSTTNISCAPSFSLQLTSLTASDKLPSFESVKNEQFIARNIFSDSETTTVSTSKVSSADKGLPSYKCSSAPTIVYSQPVFVTNSEVENRPCVNGSTSATISTHYSSSIHELSNFNSKILQSPVINLAYVCSVICRTKDECLAWLRRNGLIPVSLRCITCGSDMVSRSISRIQDGWAWCCTRTGGKRCSKRQSVRMGTWLETTSMTIENLLVFCYLWINRFDKNIIIQSTGVSSSNFIKLDKFFSRVCLQSMKNSSDITFGYLDLFGMPKRHLSIVDLLSEIILSSHLTFSIPLIYS